MMQDHTTSSEEDSDVSLSVFAALARIWVVFLLTSDVVIEGHNFEAPLLLMDKRPQKLKQKGEVGPRKKSGASAKTFGPTFFEWINGSRTQKTEVGPRWASRGIIIKGCKKSGGPTSRLGCFLLLAAGALRFRSKFGCGCGGALIFA